MDNGFGVYEKDEDILMKRSVSWVRSNAQQGVLMKVANFPAVIRNGPVPVITNTKQAKSEEEKTFIVGKSIIGGEEVIRK